MTLTFSTGSGYLNSPPRVVLIGDDNRPGSYPVAVSPVLAAKSTEYSKPYRDNIFPDTRSPYAQASVVFAAVPQESESITLTNAQGQAHTFTFKLTSPNFATGPNSYDISYATAGGLSATPREDDEGLTRAQVVTKRALEKFVQAVNAATGSLITASPTSYYNRAVLTQRIPGTAGNTANSTTSADVTIQSFTGGNAGEIRYPFGIIASGSGEVLRRVLSTAESGTLDVPVAGNASLLNAYSDGHPYAVFQPYDESNAQQAFGIGTGGSSEYGTQTQLYDEFFTRGSTLGNLDEPLSAKDKIVIDLTPTTKTTLKNDPSDTVNYQMAYFNFSTKTWERLGFGLGTNSVYANFQAELDGNYLGFSSGFDNYATSSLNSNLAVIASDKSQIQEFSGDKNIFIETGWCTPTDTFGFPLHPKYHAVDDQTLRVSDIVDRPFVVEKIVYEFSGSTTSATGKALFRDVPTFGGKELRGSGGTFFILNQRKANPDPGQENAYTNVYVAKDGVNRFAPSIDDSLSQQVIRYENGGVPQNRVLKAGGPSVYVDSVRDLITFARVGTIWPTYNQEVVDYIETGFPHPADFMELAVQVPASGSLNGIYTIASDVKSPCFSPSTMTYVAKLKDLIYIGRESFTRNSINISTGRSVGAEYSSSELLYRANSYLSAGDSKNRIYGTFRDAYSSPYIIKPGDKLVFGWQALSTYRYNSANSPNLILSPGAGKLTLYGSYLQDDKPVHDIYKDQLNSDAAHEAIPAGPWVLDRFESEPQMMYSSSMREEHVTGTMVTRGADGRLVVTDVNNLGIGGVRAISAKASDGNLGQRWSFFRNNRLFDEEEQYYDSMQPNPLEVLFTYGGGDKRAYGTSNGAFSLISIPSETYVGDSGSPLYNAELNAIRNTNFVGSFPFGEKYPNVSRVKSINSKLLSSQLVVSLTVGGNAFKNLIGVGFITGSASGNGTLSNLVRDGGLFRRAPSILKSSSDIIFVKTSREDTNPVSGASRYLADDVDSDGVNYHLSRFMGCFGSGYMQLIQYGNLSPTYPSDGSINQMFYRGVKHGLINPTPLYSSAVFNGTQFGQLRDMMEQRQYTRFSLNDNTLTDSAVDVQFINRGATPGTLNIVSGSFTNSSNISKFATSEHPYDDGRADYDLIWDRDTPLPETLIAL